MSSPCDVLTESPPELVSSPRETAQAPSGRIPHMLGGKTTPVLQLDGDLWVEVISPDEISDGLAEDWDSLSANAGSPNVFYERWNLLPALQHVVRDAKVELVLVYRRAKNPEYPSQLCGLFPLVRSRCNRLPLRAWELFTHPYCYLETPLLRAGHEHAVLHSFFDWACSLAGGPGMLRWATINGEGPFAQALADVVNERDLVKITVERRTRAMLRRKENWEDATAAGLSSHHRREMRRQHRRLMDLGDLRVRVLDAGDRLQPWQQSFLELEQSGWKGEQGTALGADPQSREYFLKLTDAAHQRGQLQMMGLFLDGRAIAMRTSLCTGKGSFAWKIAYDEQYSKFSPGVQLEIENVRHFHEETSLEWMDSCARTEHFMINRLWSDRRIVRYVLISLGGKLNNLAVGGLPLAQAIKRSLRR